MFKLRRDHLNNLKRPGKPETNLISDTELFAKMANPEKHYV